jgi:hypothetical protein
VHRPLWLGLLRQRIGFEDRGVLEVRCDVKSMILLERVSCALEEDSLAAVYDPRLSSSTLPCAEVLES